jgi:hypothetical protein
MWKGGKRRGMTRRASRKPDGSGWETRGNGFRLATSPCTLALFSHFV